MISLRPMPSDQPLAPGADLIKHLAGSGRPAIVHYTAEGRTELSGRVAVNWATKTTHLIEAYGIGSPDTMYVDLPVTWRSIVLLLGAAWCDLEFVAQPDDAAAIVTDQPDSYAHSTAAEIFVTQAESVPDASMVDVDDEVLSHADQALLPVPDIIGQAATETPGGEGVEQRSAGTLVHTAVHPRFDTGLWWVMVDAWRRSQPVILVEDATDQQVARIIETERLGPLRTA